MKRIISAAVLLFLVLAYAGCSDKQRLSAGEPPFVVREGGTVYIVDRLGERWDVTQAETVGFKPGKFQYGIGKNAFTTLDDSMLTEKTSNVRPDTRVIGIAEGDDFKAYSVRKLSRHEISNSELLGKPVAVGY